MKEKEREEEGGRREEGGERREEGRRKEGGERSGERGERREEGGERHSPITYMYHQIENRFTTTIASLALSSYQLHVCALLQVITICGQGRPGNEDNQCWRFDVN